MLIQPGAGLSPAVRRPGLRSRFLFHWRARDLSLDPLTGQIPTFSRASAGGGIRDRSGRYYTPVHSQPRWESVDINGDGIGDEVGLLLEQARTNICTESDDLSTWGLIGTPLVVGGQPDPYGGTGAFLITDDNPGGASAEVIQRGVTFTGDGTKSFSVWVHADSSPAGIVQLQDVTASVNRGSIDITNTAGVLVGVAPIGTLLKKVQGRDGWVRFDVQCPGVIAANNNQIKLRPTITTASAVGAMRFFRACAYDAAYPGSDIATAGSTVTRATDRLTAPCNLGTLAADTDDLTIYARFARPNHADAVGDIVDFPGILAIGSGPADLRLYFNASSRVIVADIRDAAPTAATATQAIPAGPVIEVCTQFKDLTVAPAVAMDVGGGLSAFVTNGLLPIASFAGAIYGLGEINGGGSKLGAPLLEVAVAPGLWSLSQVQETL